MTPLVPEKTYAVCTQGMHKGEMVVSSQNNVSKANGCLIATIKDKPTNFACVWAGILIAIVGGVIAALCTSGIGALIAGVLIAALVGIIAAHGLGGVVCYFFLRPALWINFHPKIKIDGEPALIGTSTIICKPLWFGTGNITLYYSEEVANTVANIYKWQNYANIFNWAVAGASVVALGSLGIGIASIYGCGAGIGAALSFLGLGFLINKPINNLQNWVSDELTGSNTIDVNSNRSIVESGRDVVDDSSAPPFKLAVRQNLTQLGKAQGKATMTDMWAMIKADPSYHPGMSASDLNALKSKYLSQTNADYNAAKPGTATRQTLAQGAKSAALFLGFTVGVNIVIQVIFKDKINELNEFGYAAEADAQSAVKIYEECF